MLSSRGISGLALLFAALLLPVSPQSLAYDGSARTVHIRGSSAFGHIVQSLAEQYMRNNPSTTIVVSGGGTARGYLTLLDNTSDLGMVSGPPSEHTED
jgi:ABC-type phosphate transport system substrate-binding protein